MKFDMKALADGSIVGASKNYTIEGWTNHNYLYFNFIDRHDGMIVVKFQGKVSPDRQ